MRVVTMSETTICKQTQLQLRKEGNLMINKSVIQPQVSWCGWPLLLFYICKIKAIAPFIRSKLLVLCLLVWDSSCCGCALPVIKGDCWGLLLHGTRRAFAITLIFSRTCRCNYSWPAGSCHPYTHVPLNGCLYLPTHPKITAMWLVQHLDHPHFPVLKHYLEGRPWLLERRGEKMDIAIGAINYQVANLTDVCERKSIFPSSFPSETANLSAEKCSFLAPVGFQFVLLRIFF